MLAIFAISLVVLLGAGALAFDGGMMILERRDQQNAADAAAMAGARFVTTDHSKARTTASSVASDNGFVDGSGQQTVTVNVPPTSGKFASWPNAIQVEISNTRPSILGSVMGFLNWPVSATATAASMSGQGGPFSILSLEPDQCAGVKVGGTGSIVAHGNIQVNSACPDSALQRQAGAVISAVDGAACTVHGGIQNEGGDPNNLDCLVVTPAPVIPDPLASLPDVPMPALPAAAVQEGGAPKKGEFLLGPPSWDLEAGEACNPQPGAWAGGCV